jgi:foldase protein PrsA
VYRSNFFKISVIIFLFVFIVAGCGKKENYVAKVNGEIITQAELDKRLESAVTLLELQGTKLEGEQGEMLKKLLEQETLYQLIQEKVITQEIEKQGIKLDRKKAEKQITDMEEIYGKDTFAEMLKAQKASREDIIKQIAYQIAVDDLYKKVTGDVKVTEKEAEDYFNANKEDLIQIKASHILASAKASEATPEQMAQAEEKAKGWIKQLEAGADFVQLAKKESEEPGADTSGGSLGGYFSKLDSNFVPEFTEGAFEIKEGAFSQSPVKTEFGYHVIKIEGRKETFEELKTDILERLTAEKKNEKFNDFYSDLMKKATIENKLEEKALKEAEKEAQKENTKKNTKENINDK